MSLLEIRRKPWTLKLSGGSPITYEGLPSHYNALSVTFPLPLDHRHHLPGERGVYGDLIVAAEIKGQVAREDEVIVVLNYHRIDVGAEMVVLKGEGEEW